MKEQHCNWFNLECGKGKDAFLTHAQTAMNEDWASKSIEELGLKAPSIFKFMPTNEVLVKLIRRAI
jgi:hypothetical protein